MSFPKIDWTKPIVHAMGDQKTPVEYVGPFPDKGEFRHLVLCGENRSAHWVNDFGQVKGPKLSKRIVQNPEEPKKKAAEPDADGKHSLGDLAAEYRHDELVTALTDNRATMLVLIDELREVTSATKGQTADLKLVLAKQMEAFTAAVGKGLKESQDLAALAIADVAKAVLAGKETSAPTSGAQPGAGTTFPRPAWAVPGPRKG